MIETSFGAAYTITFINRSQGEASPTVWVCVSDSVFRESLRKLRAMPYIEILQSGPSHVQER